MDKSGFVTLTEVDEFSGSGDSDRGTSLASPACFEVLVDLALLGTFKLSKKNRLASVLDSVVILVVLARDHWYTHRSNQFPLYINTFYHKEHYDLMT